MHKIMSIDGGGTKVLCLIADEEGNLLGMGTGGSANSSFNTPEEVNESVSAAIVQALDSTKGSVDADSIGTVYCAMPANPRPAVFGKLGGRVDLRDVGEFTLSLYGAIQEEYGALALAGTGSFVHLKTRTASKRVGGHGSLFGDEGSGYDIGRQALMAYTRVLDGTEPSTPLFESINVSLGEWKLSHFYEIISLPRGRQRSFISSLCRSVGQCAAGGDSVAEEILRKAGESLAYQMNGLLRKLGAELPNPLKASIAGGVWKAHPIVFSTFAELVEKENPSVHVVAPLFEPVVGGILLGLTHRGFPVKEKIDLLKERLSPFLYRLPE